MMLQKHIRTDAKFKFLMYEIEYTNSFKKDYKRILKRGYKMELLSKLFEQLMSDGNVNPGYKPHKLHGSYTGY
jgi:mRNA interferase YafQ